MSKQINDEISAILNGQTSSILDQLQTLRQELNKEMNDKFENAFKVKSTPWSMCKLNGIDTSSQKMTIMYMMDKKHTTIVQMVETTGMNRLTVTRALDSLVGLGYLTKNCKTYEIANTKIY